MNTEMKQKWVEALRSGQYTQGQESLKQQKNGTISHCCLGVLCEVAQFKSYLGRSGDIYSFEDQEKYHTYSYLPPNFRDSIDITKNDEVRLSTMNDTGKSFGYIADWIEVNL